MKKRWTVMLALAGILALTAACKDKEETTKETTGTDIASAYPESKIIRLGVYKGVEISAISTEVTDEELQAEIDNLLASYPDTQTVEGKTVVEEGDIVNIDFVGKLNGEAFEGGSSGEGGTDLEIGSGSFIDGFEDGLIGAEVGSSVELPLTFPDPYTLNPDLAGQDVVFEVTVNAIVEYVTPEWNDEFVQTYTGYDSVDAYMEGEREYLQEQKLADAQTEKENAVMQAIVKDSEFECADSDIETLVDSYVSQYETYASYYGMELEDFLNGMQTTVEAFNEEAKEWARFQIQCTLAVDAVIKAENLALTDEEYQEGLQELADSYGAESAEAFEEQYDRQTIENSLLYDKAIDFVVEQAVEI